MTGTIPPEPHMLRAALDDLRTVVERSAALVAEGDVVDLAGLDNEARDLMAHATALPAAEARSLLPVLEALLAALDGLEAAFRQTQGTDGAGTERAAARLRASAAYRRTEEP